MSNGIKYGKRVTETIYDGATIKQSEDSVSEQFTDKQYLLRDIIEALSVITKGETHKLTIEVCVDKRDRFKLTNRWRVE